MCVQTTTNTENYNFNILNIKNNGLVIKKIK